MDQVIALLGDPDMREEKEGQLCFEYTIPGLDREYNHRIFFRRDIVSLIDAAVIVDRKSPYIVSMALDEYGYDLDRVALTIVGRDILTNEHVYIWADKGVALVALPATFWELDLPPDLAILCQKSLKLEERHPAQNTSIIPGAETSPSPCHIVVRKLFFQPTTFARFWSEYESIIPELWPFYEGYVQ